MKEKRARALRRGAEGFTLTELLVVVAIVAVMGAVSVPAIARYIRNYRITAAAQQVATEINQARLRAISKVVQQGIDFIPGYPATGQFQWVTEENQNWGESANRTLRMAVPARTSPVNGSPNGVVRELPVDVDFLAATTNPVVGIRFRRLGDACGIGSDATYCPDFTSPTPGGTAYINRDSTTGEMTIVVQERRTKLKRTISILPGGRVAVQ